jgi:hypothetical protein
MGRHTYEKSTHIPFSHRAQRAKRLPLPKGEYDSPQTFIAEDGTEYVVRSGKLPTPDWPDGLSTASDVAVPARIHLPRVK